MTGVHYFEGSGKDIDAEVAKLLAGTATHHKTGAAIPAVTSVNSITTVKTGIFLICYTA